MRGVALGLYSEDPGFSYAPLLDEIVTLGASHVELVVNLYQQDGRSTALYEHTRFTATPAAITQAIRDARARGLHALLFPIVRLERPHGGEWRGTLAPADRHAWWQSYRKVMLGYARLAQAAGAAGLTIGSELSTLDGAGDLAEWQSLAGQIRRVYRGPLYYSANWDHYERVALWPLVDAVGLSAYFELASGGATTRDPAALEARWREVRQQIEQVATHLGKPILLTEVGYLSQRGAAAWPWKEGATEPVDLSEQLVCYQAFTRAWSAAPRLLGAFFWNWYGWGGEQSGGYTPRGKPAAKAIAHWFKSP
jgi:hypothetical protein